ncbi:MAG: TATA-box-binding protein [Thermoplasmatales archaeon]|nr:MAG: TATA-box-binding protein [Thermoplasmatales archaeon]
MVDIKIENIVGTTQIAESLNLDKLSEILPDSKYDPEEVPTLIIHFEKPKTVVMLFSNGKVVFTGPKNMDDAHRIIDLISEKLNLVGVKAHEKPNLQIQNIVASASIKKNLDLRSIASSIGNVEYDPERFPGLIYKTDDQNTVILIFDSGKIIGNGTKLEEISTAIDGTTNLLSSLGVL